MILARHPRAHLVSVHSAVPAQVVDRETTVSGLLQLHPDEDPEFVRNLVERSGVEERHMALPVENILAGSDFTQRNRAYREAGTELALSAARGALERASIDPQRIDAVIDVSCTGVSIPAIDVELVARLGLRSDVRRLPITESGCAAGALATGLAAQLAQGGMTVLIVAVELCSLTHCKGDRTRTNLVASVLFGDGAAAAVVAPDAPGPQVRVVGSHLFEGTQQLMGFDIGTHGMRILLQRELPVVLKKHLHGAVLGFLESHDRTLEDVGMHLIHPGGRRIIDTYLQLFSLEESALRHSRESLRRYGNLSSASILTVLELALQAGERPAPGTEALVLAIGPGLAAEMMLLGWED